MVTLFVSANRGGGGSEELWVQTAAAMAGRGDQVMAATTWLPRASRRIQQLRRAGIPHYELHPSRLGRLMNRVSRGGTSPSAAELRNCLNKVRPSRIVFNSGTLLDGLDLLGVIQGWGVPYLVVTHLVSTDNWPDDRAAEQLVESFAHAARSCFVSGHNLELFERQVGCSLSNSEIVRNPFLVSATPSKEWPTREGGDKESWRLAFPARLHPRTKGQDMLIDVLSRDEWKGRPLTVTFYGEGPCRTSLERLATQRGVSGVRFGGQVSDIEGVWRSHHALILPSRHEGLPICLIEAMMSSRPVIANPAGGSGEVIEDGVTGFLGSSCDVQGLRNLMERAWSERDAWEQMGQSAFNRIRQLIPADPVDQFLKSLGEWLPPSTRVPNRSD